MTRAAAPFLAALGLAFLPTGLWTVGAPAAETPAEQSLQREDVNRMLADAYLMARPNLQGDLSLSLLGPWPPIVFKGSREAAYVAILRASSTELRSRFVARFEVRVGEDVLYSGQAPVEAELFQDVWVAPNRVERGQRLDPAALRREKRNVLALRGEPVPAAAALAGFEAVATLLPRNALLKTQIRRAPIIFRGDQIDAVLVRGLLRIAMKVEALSNGAPGEPIRVKNLQTKRQLLATVENESTVRLN